MMTKSGSDLMAMVVLRQMETPTLTIVMLMLMLDVFVLRVVVAGIEQRWY